ncbi:MAG: polysaccharide deacetylase family protein [bacterium]
MPERSALITFDDGLRNNYDVAFPVLAEHSIPAAIFLATEFVDSERFFWFDELYFLLREAIKRRASLSDLNLDLPCKLNTADLAGLYMEVVQAMKTMAQFDMEKRLNILRREFEFDKKSLVDDFGVLSWSQVREMNSSGLIEFGVHTANHRILQHLARDEWEKELGEPRQMLSRVLGKEVLSFCYPNGRPGIDFEAVHVDYLRRCGYHLAFTTQARLHNSLHDDWLQIARIPAGHDFTSDPHFFRINTSGFCYPLRKTESNSLL